MDAEVKRKIDLALARVKEPQSDVPIADLGLVGKVRYLTEEKSITVTLAIGYAPGQCPACLAVNEVVKNGIARRVKESFAQEFPEFSIAVD